MMKFSSRSVGVSLLTSLLLVGGATQLLPEPVAVGQDSVDTSERGIKRLDVVVGSQKVITVPYDFGDISIGNSSTANITPMRGRREILVFGTRPGINSIIIFDTRGNRRDEYEIQVLSENLERTMKNIRNLLGDIEGLKYRIIGDKIVIEGEVFLEDEIRRVTAVAEKNPNIIQNVTLSPVTLRVLANTIEKEIGRPEITARPLRNQILLEGTIYSEVAKVRAEAIARAYANNIINVLEVRQADRPPSKEKTVVLIAHYVNLSKSLLNSWGIDWAPLAVNNGSLTEVSIAYKFDPETRELYTDSGANGITLSSGARLLMPRIQRAKTSGYARVLENPTVSVKSGEVVSMFSGLQYPYPVYYQGGVSIEWKDIGIKMDATPYAQGDSVDMKLKIEVTDLGQLSNSNGDPAIDTSKIETRQYCKAGESIVIGGLSRLSDGVLYNRSPETVEGALVHLFKNRQYNKAKSQFLVFITPQIHETSSTANKEIQEKFNLKEVKQ